VVAIASLVPTSEKSARESRSDRMVIAVLFFMVASYFVVRRGVLGSTLSYFPRFTHGAIQAVALTLSIVAHYAYKLVWPFRLDAESDFTPPAGFFNAHTLVGLLVVVAVV
jgi:hypothetical protein